MTIHLLYFVTFLALFNKYFCYKRLFSFIVKKKYWKNQKITTVKYQLFRANLLTKMLFSPHPLLHKQKITHHVKNNRYTFFASFEI